jgi:hypothetical protein
MVTSISGLVRRGVWKVVINKNYVEFKLARPEKNG